MLGTLTTHLTISDGDLVHDNFTELLQIQVEKGHITYHDYDRLGFPPDVNFEGGVVNRYSENDSSKRAFLMNHQNINKVRKEEVLKGRKALFDKEKKKYHSTNKVVLKNKVLEKN